MKRTVKKSSRLSVESTLVQVARLYYENNLSQQEIADMLGVISDARRNR